MSKPIIEPRFIAIEGAIGAGKTSLAKLLGNEFDARIVLEKDVAVGQSRRKDFLK